MFACGIIRSTSRSGWRHFGNAGGSPPKTPLYNVTKFDNFILRLTRTTKGPVSNISIDVMERAVSRFRIGLMFVMMGFAAVGSIVAVVLGKRDRAAHVGTLQQRNKERHAKALEKWKKEQGSSSS